MMEKERYREGVSNESHVNSMYINVLGRDYDQAGYEYLLRTIVLRQSMNYSWGLLNQAKTKDFS